MITPQQITSDWDKCKELAEKFHAEVYTKDDGFSLRYNFSGQVVDFESVHDMKVYLAGKVSNPQYTEGPWTYTISDNGDNFHLTNCYGEEIIGGCGCSGSPWMQGNNPFADALLIKSAPDLIKVCVYAYGLLDAGDTRTEFIANVLKNAVQNATGVELKLGVTNEHN